MCRGNTVMLVCPEEGYEEIENPFAEVEEEEGEEEGGGGGEGEDA